MDPRNLSGSLKAAILIHSMGKEVAETILNGLSENEKKLVNRHLSQMKALSPEVVEHVAREFTDRASQRTRAIQPAHPLKPDRAKIMGIAEAASSENEGLDAILSLSADEIFELLKEEHPQTIAIILIHLKTPIASDVLSKLPDEIKQLTGWSETDIHMPGAYPIEP